MNIFDLSIMAYVNQLSQYSWALDRLILFLSGNHLLKGGVFCVLIWWAWFKENEHQSLNREHLTTTLISCVIAMSIARVMALSLPFRPRPLYEDNLVFLLPYGMEKTNMESWSSFPSDHAALFFTLATGLFFVSRKLGAFALVYALVFIALPRIYLGLHYPTDIIFGAAIGITTCFLANTYLVPRKNLKLIASWSYSKPDYFYPVFFIFTYQIADLFNGFRAFISAAYKLFQGLS